MIKDKKSVLNNLQYAIHSNSQKCPWIHFHGNKRAL